MNTRTKLTEMGEEGATNAEIVSFSGHHVISQMLSVYVKPARGAAQNARQVRELKEVPQFRAMTAKSLK